MNLKNINVAGTLGAIIVMVAGFFPLLHLPVVGNWNYWKIDAILASLVYLFAALSLIAAVLNKNRMLKICGWTVWFLVVLTLAGIWFKVDNAFSFIPLKKLARFAGKMVEYQWYTWLVIFLGIFFIITGAGREERR